MIRCCHDDVDDEVDCGEGGLSGVEEEEGSLSSVARGGRGSGVCRPGSDTASMARSMASFLLLLLLFSINDVFSSPVSMLFYSMCPCALAFRLLFLDTNRFCVQSKRQNGTRSLCFF